MKGIGFFPVPLCFFAEKVYLPALWHSLSTRLILGGEEV